MKIFYSLCLGLLVSISSFSQYQIELVPEVFYTDSIPFYVSMVIDCSEKELLGEINDQKCYLSPSKSKGVQNFLEANFSKQLGTVPIVVVIDALTIENVQTEASVITARVHIELTFLDTCNDVIFRVFHDEDERYNEFTEVNIIQTYRNQIQLGLEYGMCSFIDQWKYPKMDWEKEYVKSISDQNKLVKYKNMITYKKIYSRYTEGWRIAYTGFSDSGDDLIIPYVFYYDQVRLKSDVLRQKKIKSVDTYTLGTGLNGYVKMLKGFYVGVGIEVPLGVEVIETLAEKKRTHFLIGVNVKEGILIMPWEDFGIVMGLNIFQNFRSSKVYQSNYGFEWEVGINF